VAPTAQHFLNRPETKYWLFNHISSEKARLFMGRSEKFAWECRPRGRDRVLTPARRDDIMMI
jgi:hypothetical protein